MSEKRQIIRKKFLLIFVLSITLLILVNLVSASSYYTNFNDGAGYLYGDGIYVPPNWSFSGSYQEMGAVTSVYENGNPVQYPEYGSYAYKARNGGSQVESWTINNLNFSNSPGILNYSYQFIPDIGGSGSYYIEFINNSGIINSTSLIYPTVSNWTLANYSIPQGTTNITFVVTASNIMSVNLYFDMVNISDYSSLETNINLISPVNNYVTSNSSVIFNGTVSSSNPIQSVTLDINGLFNQTDHSGINNTNYIFIVNGLIGSNNWSYTVCDTYNFCNTSNTNTFTVLSNTIFTDVNITDNLIVGQNLSALNGFFNSLGNLLQPILNLFVTNAMISTATITNLNVTGLLYGDGSHLTNIPMTNSSYYLATNPNNYTAYGITWYNAMNGTLALMSNLSDYYLASNPSNYYNNITLQNLSQLRDNLGGRGYTSLSNFTNNEGFYNSTNPPPANEPNWNGNASNVAYTNKANIFNGSINVLGNSNVTGNSTVTYTHYNSQALATCGASYYGDIGRNSSGLYYCSSTSKWIRLASG